MKRELGKVSFRIAITSYIVNSRYTVYRERVPVHGIVRDTLNNLFVRMIDEKNVWFILVIKIIYFSVSTFNCCFLLYLVSIK